MHLLLTWYHVCSHEVWIQFFFNLSWVPTPWFCAFKCFSLCLMAETKNVPNNAQGNWFPKSHQRWIWPGLIHGTPPVLIEAALFWDQGLPLGSTCGQDLLSAFHYQKLPCTLAPKMLIPGSEWCILEQWNCNFCIIYVLCVWYANREHYYFCPYDIWLHDPSWPRPSVTQSEEQGQLFSVPY